MTITANGRHHTKNLVHGKLAVDETCNHCIARYSKTCVKIIQTAFYIASRRSPNIQHSFEGWAVGSEHSAVFNQLDWKKGDFFLLARLYSINLIEKRFQLDWKRKCCHAAYWSFPFLGFVDRAVCGQRKHTGQTTWRYIINFSLASAILR